MTVIHKNPVYQSTHALCSEHICVKDAIIRYPMIFGSLFHWRHFHAKRWSPRVELVIPTISQDCPNLEIHEG